MPNERDPRGALTPRFGGAPVRSSLPRDLHCAAMVGSNRIGKLSEPQIGTQIGMQLGLVLVLVLGAMLAGACDRGHPQREAPVAEPPAAPGAPNASSPAAAAAPATPASVPGCTLDPLPVRRPAARRLVAIGDLHGDLAATRAALRAAGAIDDRDHWSGGDLVVVQTGDALDRGDDERAILDLIARLEAEAAAAGGALIALLGNHELMNAAGDFRYVTPGGLHAFDDAPGPAAALASRAPEQMKRRIAALGPGGSYARQLAHHAVIAIVGDTVFSHAGVLAAWAPEVDAANQRARCWLDGQASQPPPVLTADDGPVWTRAFGGTSVDCAELHAALDALHVQRMVVGHTVQPGGINAACDGALWRIDAGMTKVFGGPIQVLQLAPGPPKVLAGAR
jgi:hypothetical protein